MKCWNSRLLHVSFNGSIYWFMIEVGRPFGIWIGEKKWKEND